MKNSNYKGTSRLILIYADSVMSVLLKYLGEDESWCDSNSIQPFFRCSASGVFDDDDSLFLRDQFISKLSFWNCDAISGLLTIGTDDRNMTFEQVF